MMKLVNFARSVSEWNKDQFETLESLVSPIIVEDEFDRLPETIQDEIYLIDMWEIEELEPDDVIKSINTIEDYIQRCRARDIKKK